jgi:hypothetical protein
VREHMTHLHPEAKKIADAHGRGRPWNERNAKTAPIELRRRRRHSRSRPRSGDLGVDRRLTCPSRSRRS